MTLKTETIKERTNRFYYIKLKLTFERQMKTGILSMTMTKHMKF